MDELHDAERRFISEIGTLSPTGYNVSYGGDTAPSTVPEVKAKISAKAKGRRVSDTAKAKIGKATARLWGDPEYRERVSAGIKAAMTPEYRAAMSERARASRLGKKHSEETLAKLRAKTFSDETRRKMSEAAKRRIRPPKSPETCRKLADATKRAWADPKTTERRLAAIRAAWTPEKRKAFGDAKRGKPRAKSSIAQD